MSRVRGGFTLIEVIVALTVASLALGAGFAALGIVRDRGGHAEEAARVALAGATQRALLMDWLSNARLQAPAGEQFQGEIVEENGKTMARLFFPTTARTPLEGTFTLVGLYIDEDPETPEQGLVAELVGVVLGSEERRMEIVPEAAAMTILYRPDVDGEVEWTDTWRGNTLPRGIEITLFPADGDTLPRLLRLPIRVALGVAR